jgi:methyl-accepting chemotaxis protein
MTIAQRLIALVAFSSAGLLCVAGVSYVAVTSVQSELKGLTLRAAPLQMKTYELQERTERLVGSLLKLTLTRGREEASTLTTAIQAQATDIERLRGEIRAIDANRRVDFSEFEAAQREIATAVGRRVADEAAYREETEKVRAALERAEKAVAATRTSVQQIGVEAGRAADQAQESMQRLAHSMKVVLTSQTRLKEITLLLADLDAIPNRFRISPLSEKLRAAFDAVLRLAGEGGGKDVLAEPRAAVSALQGTFFRDGTGLLALRAAMLTNREEGEPAYKKQRQAIVALIEEQSQKLSAIGDTIEIELAKHRRSLETALKLRNEPGGVVTISEDVALGIREMVGATRLLMLSSSEAEVRTVHEAIRKLVESLTTHMQAMRTGLIKMARPQLTQQVDSALAAMAEVAGSVDKVAQSKGRLLASEALMARTLERLKQVAQQQSQAGEAEVKTIAGRQRAITEAVDRRVESSLLLVVSISALIIVATVALGLLTHRLVTRRLDQSVRVAEAVSRGELIEVPPATGKDETARLLRALGSMVTTLTGIVRHISAASAAINTGTHEIGRGNHDLSQRTEEQATSLGHTTEAVERLTETIRHNVEAARQATVLAQSASEVATRGGKAVGDVVTTMTDIHASSRQNAEITGVIDSMAFETNLLALNAAIEAARAGEHGRGFAVVAAEVRGLARKSAEAAHTIRRIVKDTVSRVEAGADEVDIAGKTMAEIVSQVGRVSALITDMSRGSEAQSTSVGQVKSAITTLDEMTRRNAALAEESTAATATLHEQAEALADAVSAFRLSGDTTNAQRVRTQQSDSGSMELGGSPDMGSSVMRTRGSLVEAAAKSARA